MKQALSYLSILFFIVFISPISCTTEYHKDFNTVGTRVDALDNSLWELSDWISVVDAPVVNGKVYSNRNCMAADGASWFVSSVQNTRRVVSAKWMTTALGVFDIYVNGKRVGEEVLKPGFTDYAKTKYSFTYDVTDAIRKGMADKNTFSAQVTPGWWADKIVTPSGSEGMKGQKCAFRSVLELTYDNGTKDFYGTDTESWKAGIAGPVKHAAIFDGEYYDARELPGFMVTDQLSAPEVNHEFKGEILPSSGAEVYFRHDLTLRPVRIYVWSGVSGASDEVNAGEGSADGTVNAKGSADGAKGATGSATGSADGAKGATGGAKGPVGSAGSPDSGNGIEKEYGKVNIIREYEDGDRIRLNSGETLVVDFGQNSSAVPSFVFRASEGTVLTCLPSEILNDGNGAESRGMDGPEGSCHRRNLRTHDFGMKLEYTFADNDDYVDYTPRCTFFGYRYVSITSTDEVEILSIESIPVTSVTANMETGKIKTGNDLVNKLISNTRWGMYSNYLSVPTDCPQRNERLGWTADTQVFAETGSYFADISSFLAKWLRDLRDSQSSTGAFPGVAPFSKAGLNMMRLGWADAGIIVPWTVWKQYGDNAVIEENWDAMERFINHVNETKYDHNALKSENRNYQWADWLSYEPLESCGQGAFTKDVKGKRTPLPEAVEYWNYLSASYWLIDASMMKDMAAATGRDAKKYELMEARARKYIREEFFTKEGMFKTEILNTMQTPALFALKNNLFEGEIRNRIIANLRENFKQHDNCLQTGFLGTSILMTTLTENGMTDIAYELLFQRKNPSWIYSIDNGATTIWERWNSYTIEYGMGPKSMNSFNHYAYGCVCEWIWETAAGIACDPSAPGFRRIKMNPIPDKRLGFVDAEYKTPVGVVRSSWKYEGDVWRWTFTIPAGAVADVTLPGEKDIREYGPGTYCVEQLVLED